MLKNKPYLMTAFLLALVSFGSATILTLEKIQLWIDSDYVPSCSFNPLFSCQGPMQSWQSSVFGIPNPIIGMVGFALVLLITFTALFIELPNWYWTLYSLGITAAFGFTMWLSYQSIFDIGALCLYCMIVWTTMTALFWLTIPKLFLQFNKYSKAAKRFHSLRFVLMGITYFIIALVLFVRFEAFWLSLF